MDSPESKRCSKCKETKPLNLFYTLKPRSKGPRKHSWCIVCTKAEYQRRKVAQAEWSKSPARRKISRERSMDVRYRNPAANMFKAAKFRAKLKGVPFNLEPSDVIIPTHCPILGIPIIPKTGHGIGSVRGDSPTLDRIIGQLGYVKGNVMVISFRANAIKSNATPSEMAKILDYMRKYDLTPTDGTDGDGI